MNLSWEIFKILVACAGIMIATAMLLTQNFYEAMVASVSIWILSKYQNLKLK